MKINVTHSFANQNAFANPNPWGNSHEKFLRTSTVIWRAIRHAGKRTDADSANDDATVSRKKSFQDLWNGSIWCLATFLCVNSRTWSWTILWPIPLKRHDATCSPAILWCVWLFSWKYTWGSCMVCVCVWRLNRRKTSNLGLSSMQGAQAHCGYLCQRSYSTMGEAEIDHLRVPALFDCCGKGLSREPQSQWQWLYFFTVATICYLLNLFYLIDMAKG